VALYLLEVVAAKNACGDVLTYVISNCLFVDWLVGGHLLLRDFGPHWLTFVILCVMAVAMVMPIRCFRLYGITFLIIFIYYF
jgi:hypothetical protein